MVPNGLKREHRIPSVKNGLSPIFNDGAALFCDLRALPCSYMESLRQETPLIITNHIFAYEY